MAKKYDDYGDEKNNSDGSFGLGKKILIIAMVVVAIILILVLIKGCGSDTKPSGGGETPSGGGNQPKPVDVSTYETSLLTGGKAFFNNTIDANPTAPGECSIVELQTLINNKYVDPTIFANCDVTQTYLKQCVLENGTKQFTPWLGCTDNNSETTYDALVEGNLGSIYVDSTYTEFTFMPQVLKKGQQQLGSVEELWKDDIEYESYKTLKTTKYYRYRDKQYIWELVNRSYYSKDGVKSDPAKVTDYYTTSPATGYTLSSNKTDAYKWYTTTSGKEYYMVNGAKQPSPTAVGEYTIKDPQGIDVTRYRTRTKKLANYGPTRYYKCATSASSRVYIYRTSPCGTNTNNSVIAQYSYTVDDKYYSCVSSNASNDEIISNHVAGPNSKCYQYSEWSSATSTKCDTTQTDICQSVTVTFYYWYKLVNDIRTYYPSGASKASGEKVYYVEAPIKGAIKDTSSKASAYKWYKETRTTTSGYSATAPKGYYSATKTSQSRYTDWSDWSTKNPKVSDGREREIETKTKIKLQQYLGVSEDSWVNLKEEYMTEEDLIKAFKEKGYKVNTLEDIVNNGETRYQIKMYVRNKRR